MFKHTILLLICLFAFTHCFTEDNHVIVLDKGNFNQVISTYENVLVEFYAPWCGHCQKLEPEYSKAAEYFKQEGKQVRLAKVDCTVEEEICKNFGIEGFPTLLIFMEGKPSEYTGGRTANTIIGWVKKKTEIPTVIIEKLSDLETVVQKAEVAVIFFGDEFDAGFKLYRKVASDNMEIPFFHTTSQEFIDKYNPSGDRKVVMVRNFDEREVNFEDIFTSENIEAFVLKNRFPKIVDYNNKYARVIFGDRYPALFLMTGRGDTTDKAIEILKELAPEFYGKFLITLCDTEDELCQKVVKYFGLIREEVPAIYFFKPPTPKERPEKYLFEGRITKENIRKFYEDFTNGKLSPVLRSEEVPEENKDPLKNIVGKIYRDVVFDEDKDVIVFYSGESCADCKEYLKEFQGFAKLVTPIEDLIVGQIDLERNEVKDLKFDSFPQILLYPRDKKDTPISYKGPKDLKTIFNYFKDSLTVEFDENKLNIDETIKTIRREAEEKEKADELARQKMEQLAESQRVKQEAEAAAEAQAKEHAEKISQESDNKKKADIDL